MKFFCLAFLATFAGSQLASAAQEDSYEFVEKEVFHGFVGKWKGWKKGSVNSYACGAEMKYEDKKVGDNSGGTGLKLTFCDIDDWGKQTEVDLYSNKVGEWKGMKMCSKNFYVDGAQAQIDPVEGARDYTAMNGLKIRCREQGSTATEWITVHTGDWGDWEAQVTDSEKYVKEAQVIFEDPLEWGDDTALNGLSFRYEIAVTPSPTKKPTSAPTKKPTSAPTKKPTSAPTKKPTSAPTKKPTSAPTKKPTSAPTKKPTSAPTKKPTSAPTKKPTSAPTKKPTSAPTKKPTSAPTKKPTSAPTKKPAPKPSGTNISKGKPSKQSSTCFGGLAARAVDGNTDGIWSHNSVSHTCKNPMNSWWVAIGPSKITKIVIWNRTDCCAERINGAVLQILNSSKVVTSNKIVGTKRSYTFNFASVYGTLVKVSLANQYLSLAEVQVFGYSTSNPTPVTPPTPKPAPFKKGYSCEGKNQGKNLGGGFSTPQQCLAVALKTAGCGSSIMWSNSYNKAWGCRCCVPGAIYTPHNLWDIYQGTKPAPKPVPKPAPVTTPSWKLIPGKLKWVSVNGNGSAVWGVNAGDNIYYRAGTTGSWKLIPGKLKQIKVSGDGVNIWGVNSGDNIYFRAGVSGAWKLISGKLVQVSCSGNGKDVWGVNRGQYIYYRNGVNGAWKLISGRLVNVEVSADRKNIWGVNVGNNIYYRAGVNGAWKLIPGKLKNLTVNNNGAVIWGVNSGDYIYYRAGVSGAWKLIPGRLKQIHVSGDACHVWGVNSGDNIYYRHECANGPVVPVPKPAPVPAVPSGAYKKGFSCEGRNQGKNLGGGFSTPQQCLAVALRTAGCGSSIMWSNSYNKAWGCRCCVANAIYTPHNLWDIYQGTKPAPKPPPRPAPVPAKPTCTYSRKYFRKWPHCANIKCTAQGTSKASMEAMCNSYSNCTGFSFSTGASRGWGCLKKCGAREFGGYGATTHDYWVKTCRAAPKPAPKCTFAFYPYMDSSGNDIGRYTGGVANYKRICLANPKCTCFNSNGWVKYITKPSNHWNRWTNNRSLGLYVKRCSVIDEE